MVKLEDQSILERDAEEEFKHPLPQKHCDDGRMIYLARNDYGPLRRGVGVIRICDFDLAVLGHNPHKACIQGEIYRAPEVIPDPGYTYSADIWSLGVMLWDLLEGKELFKIEEPERGQVYKHDEDKHLAYITALLGDAPPSLLKPGDRASLFYDEKGRLRRADLVPSGFSFGTTLASVSGPEKQVLVDISVYTLSVFPGASDGLGEPRVETQAKFKEFILVFQLDGTYIYRDQIRANVLVGQYFCDVDIGHLISYDEELAHQLTTNPTEMISLFEAALRQCTQRIVYPQQPEVPLPQHQLLLHSSIAHTSIRDLNATAVEHLVRIPGIVIGASAPCTKARLLVIQCRSCAHVSNVAVDGGISSVSLPRTCGRAKVLSQQDSNEPCPLDPYFVLHEKSLFVNQQMLKLQEAPDQVPVGELPRHILISADRYLANRVIPGNRCTVMAPGAAVAIRAPYLRCVGITTDASHLSTSALSFSDAEIQEFEQMSRLPDLYGRFARCIAPSIYGNLDIKKAIACLLMGGSKKILPDGMRLRGDINVLLLGDPGTAKSQLLKFVEKASPIAIYTSGKGSSAAGLTASVQRDVTTREFYLEGGAMVLADGGVVCIDEFDKMRDEDRVAIHEAMEQQTISIAKAGITTILNARTSVLAAANPIFGRYDDLKSPGENIDFQTTILSRFDMIFIVRDDHDRARDERIAKHVILAASEKLSSHFVSIRNRVAQSERTANARSSIPITVRQLEAIIRITESLAKLTLSPVADESHVDEAIRLFLASTMDAVAHGDGAASAQLGTGARNRELHDEVAKLSDELLRRLPIGWSTGLGTLRREFVTGRGYSDASLERALYVLQRRETLRIRGGTAGGQVYRSGV
ncbi:hypothetical protein DV737_g1457, partial [Chaetothyriales sp. CBS 132003]